MTGKQRAKASPAKRGQPKRALIVIRLSRVTEATTSPERQLKECQELCAKRGYAVVDVVEDLDVSGRMSPFDRKNLGDWLANRHYEFDVIVVFKMDRLVRKLFDLADMVRWSREHGVAIVSANEPFFDLTNEAGEMMAMLVAWVAQMELESISTRNASASTHNIRSGKWRGGMPPWGYVPERGDDKVWRLVQDPEQVEVIQEVVERVLAGEPLRPIAADLTKRGVLTPKDRFAQIKGREIKGYAWASNRMKESLLSRTLLGQIVTRDPVLDDDGKVQRDAKGHRVLGPEFVVTGDDGRPVVRAEPILTRAVFDQVGAALAARGVQRSATTLSGLLLKVLFCGECGRPAYRLKGGPGRKPRYRCAYAQDKKATAGITGPCDNRSVPLEWADEEVEKHILERLGPMERRVRVWFAGNDISGELADVDEALVDLTKQLGSGAFRQGTPQRKQLDSQIEALAKRQEELAAKPVEAPRWVYEGTGETVREWWERSDPATRTAWLQAHGVRVTWRSHTENGRTQLDAFDIDLGSPDLSSGALPGAVATTAELKAVDAWGYTENLRGLPETLAEAYWQQGDPLLPPG